MFILPGAVFSTPLGPALSPPRPNPGLDPCIIFPFLKIVGDSASGGGDDDPEWFSGEDWVTRTWKELAGLKVGMRDLEDEER